MTIDIQYFGMISDRLQLSSEKHTFERSGEELNLRAYFEKRFPVLKEINYKIAVNQEFSETVQINPEIKEIALLPPFAGG